MELSKHLKHEIRSKDIVKEKVKQRLLFTDNELKKLPEIVKKMEDQFLPKWHDVKDQYALYKIEEFAHELSKFAKDVNIKYLDNYANKLLEDVEIVDLDSLSDTLGKFPKIIEELQEAREQTLINKSQTPKRND